MLHRSFQRPAITAQTIILQTLSNYVKIPLHVKQTLTHAFPLLLSANRKLLLQSTETKHQNLKKATAMLHQKVLLKSIYLPKKASAIPDHGEEFTKN